ncbi:MAG: hypothetical protein JOS17DRAFT_463019 [Linnemannia elongata]|nr:MAG: hypothetical protein JOS17DRAFT_463019 [Linnemannia elongata]
MTTILDLPPEIHPLIANHLRPKSIYALLRTCHSLYSLYMPLLWPDISVGLLEYKVAAAHISTHAHFVESLCYFGGLDEDYYTSIVYPRLRTLQLPEIIMFQSEISRAGPYPLYFPNSRGRTSSSIEGLQVSADISLSHPMTQFARLNPTVRKLTCGLRHKESRMFWEVVETDWKELEEVTVSGGVDEDVVETFWRVCSDRVRSLYLTPDGFSEDGLGIISTLSFERLERLALIVCDFHKLTGTMKCFWLCK